MIPLIWNLFWKSRHSRNNLRIYNEYWIQDGRVILDLCQVRLRCHSAEGCVTGTHWLFSFSEAQVRRAPCCAYGICFAALPPKSDRSLFCNLRNSIIVLATLLCVVSTTLDSVWLFLNASNVAVDIGVLPTTFQRFMVSLQTIKCMVLRLPHRKSLDVFPVHHFTSLAFNRSTNAVTEGANFYWQSSSFMTARSTPLSCHPFY